LRSRSKRARLKQLVKQLDAAVVSGNPPCREVKRVLVDAVAEGRDLLGPDLLRPSPDGYARRLVHRDPGGRYSVVAMVWDRGQGTPIHDHAGRWCVECVFRGRMRVTAYRLGETDGTETVTLRTESEIVTGVGEGGALIPPFEHHAMANADESPAVTIHVYSGELVGCSVFHPLGGDRYRRVWKPLIYTP
jgi:predicted metal-dependent enzyme (double-stranded beta helix superfamily)